MIARSLDRWWVRSLAGTGFWGAVLLALIAVIASFGSPTDKRVAMTFLIYLVVTIGVQTFAGNSGILSFGHVGFMAVGAYTAAVLSTAPSIKVGEIPDAPSFVLNAKLHWVVAVLLAVVVAGIVGLILGVPIVRLSGTAGAVGTLGLLVIVYAVLSNYSQLTRGAEAFYGAPPYTTLYRGVAVAAIALLASRLFRESRLGLGLRSSREDELAARASGVNVFAARLVAWVLSAAIAGLGGALYAGYIPAMTPAFFYFDLTFIIVTMVIVGGSSTSAAALGAGIVTLVTEFLRRLENGFSLGPLHVSDAPGLSTIGVGVLIGLTMMLRPQGLIGRWEVDEVLLNRLRSRWPEVEEGEREPKPGASGSLVGSVGRRSS